MPELTETQLMLVVVAVVVLAILAIFVSIQIGRGRRRRLDLRARFGSEYDRTLEQAGSRRAGEDELYERLGRHRHVSLAVPSPEVVEEHRERLESLQAMFVTSPVAAVRRVDGLVVEAAVARGYPDGAATRILSDVSVDHPEKVAAHRRGQHLLTEAGAEQQPDTERLRCAFVGSRELIETLLAEDVTDAAVHRGGPDEAEFRPPAEGSDTQRAPEPIEPPPAHGRVAASTVTVEAPEEGRDRQDGAGAPLPPPSP